MARRVGAFLADRNPPHAGTSLAVAAHRLGIPLTVHVAIGTDIMHMHPRASGAAIGDASLRDFRYFTSSVARLGHGVYLNCGSAVVLPEIFLKAVAAGAQPRHRARRADDREHRLPAAVPPADQRGHATGGRHRPASGISLVGHHEILIPLIAAAVIEADGRADRRPALQIEPDRSEARSNRLIQSGFLPE